jgi:hypothetical protein
MTFGGVPAFAAIPVYSVGGTITNPQTGGTETVIALIGNYSVQTDQNHVILLAQTVGDTYSISTTVGGTTTTTNYKVTAVTAGSGGASPTVTIDATVGSTTTSSTIAVVVPVSGVPAIGGGTGSAGTFTFPAAAGDVNQYIDIRQGGNGGNGRDGGGVCFGALGCIQYAPGNGGAGGTGPTINDVIAASWGLITTTSTHAPGIVVAQYGGNGGNGGFGVGNIPPAQGGVGGNSTVTATNHTTVVTRASAARHAGASRPAAGAGGNCYVACSGGGGGAPGSGGNATGTNYGQISTSGTDAAGLVVQSMGGSAGTGGDSYGIVGSGGAGGYGGNAGEAHAFNNGVISTTGAGAYGVLAQSIGGVGGNSGSSGGIVAFGGSGGGAGSGSTAEAGAGAGSSTITGGNFAHGIFARRSAAAGRRRRRVGRRGIVRRQCRGRGGLAQITVVDGAYGQIGGTGAFGSMHNRWAVRAVRPAALAAFSTWAGLADPAAAADCPDQFRRGTLVTTGLNSRGVFAQSVGGGGGTANRSGGGLAGDRRKRRKRQRQRHIELGEQYFDRRIGADAVYAQSVGGGGGSGANSGGVVALGGSGRPAARADSFGQHRNDRHSQRLRAASLPSRSAAAAAVAATAPAGGDRRRRKRTGGRHRDSLEQRVSHHRREHVDGDVAQSIGGGGGDGGTSGAALLTIGGDGAGGGARPGHSQFVGPSALAAMIQAACSHKASGAAAAMAGRARRSARSSASARRIGRWRRRRRQYRQSPSAAFPSAETRCWSIPGHQS